MRQIGTVKSWFDGKGFGFIVKEGGPGDIFVHHTQVRMQGRRSLSPGQQVQFVLQSGDKGLSATNVELLEGVDQERCHACGQGLSK